MANTAHLRTGNATDELRKHGHDSWVDGFKVAYRNFISTFYNDEKQRQAPVERDLQRVRLIVRRLLAASSVAGNLDA